MKCFNPVRMYTSRASDGSLSYFHSSNGISVWSEIFRPCGFCLNCRLTRAQDWAVRCTHEASLHSESCFLTLTYDDSHLPLNGSLDYSHVSTFIKDLRRRLDRTSYKSSITFFRVGEYGSDYSRPHYHLLLFGFDFSFPLTFKGVRNTRTSSAVKDSRTYFKSSFATDLWSRGFVDIGSVDFSTSMYVAKYVTKFSDSSQSSLHEPERASMSKRVPIGLRWIERHFSDVYPDDFVWLNGKRFSPPKFYDRWLAANHPRLYSQVKSSREASISSSFPDTQSLHASQFIAVQKHSSFSRSGVFPNLIHDSAQLDSKLAFINSFP